MEFGSDFHTIEYLKGGRSLLEIYPQSNLYASGRQALLDLAIARGWKRLWVPSYFCEESLECVRRTGIELCSYPATPKLNPDKIPSLTDARENDGLLIVNYFGLFDVHHFADARCEIVEDHTHNLIGNWALNSSADWCIASLRKTLPIPDGGILWSSKKHQLPPYPELSQEVADIMEKRGHAMNLKQQYLRGGQIDKSDFLNLFQQTEECFDSIKISRISDVSRRIVSELDIAKWYNSKKDNWLYLKKNIVQGDDIEILSQEKSDDTPFSIILLLRSKEMRENVRRYLISHSVYPAILWTIESEEDKSAQQFGDTMLSIHCDGRYSVEDMKILSELINGSLN